MQTNKVKLVDFLGQLITRAPSEKDRAFIVMIRVSIEPNVVISETQMQILEEGLFNPQSGLSKAGLEEANGVAFVLNTCYEKILSNSQPS